MKKCLTAILVFIMSLFVPGVGVFTYAMTTKPEAGTAEQYFQDLKISGYDISGDIIITQPNKIERTTTADNISILGASDADFPLYMNKRPVKLTEKGFFAQYVNLREGENTFVFLSNNKEATIVITKEKIVELLEDSELIIYDEPTTGTICVNYASRRTKPDESPELLTPLAYGTEFKFIGETGDYYLIEDFTYVYKIAVEAAGGELQEKIIEGMEIVAEDGFTYLRFKMNVNALYNLEREENKVRLKIFAKHDLSEPDIEDSPLASLTKEKGDGGFIYDFSLKERIVGHFVEFDDGFMTVGFKHAPDGIEGAKVVLDAGHGGSDVGALGPPGELGPVEKDFNLYVTLAAKKYLEARGVEVHLTRSEDEYVSLTERVAEIYDYKPDISVSIHANSMPVTEDFNLFSGPLMFYTFDGGKEAATQLYENIVSSFELEYKEPIKDNFALTRITNCPALLFEIGFLCNPLDYEQMLDVSFLERMGEALGEGIETYLLSLSE